MGEIELIELRKEVIIHSEIVLYGESASRELAIQLSDEIETMWNEAEGHILYKNNDYRVIFKTSGEFNPYLTELAVLENTNPRINYFRVEDYSPLNISWVDGIGSNTGYFLIDNLYLGSTTAAHEYGHSLGLDHPEDLNLIGQGTPGLMYPRGTLVDAEYQYDMRKQPGEIGGTMHPKYRKVLQSDIDLLYIPRLLQFDRKEIGKFTSIYHQRIEKPRV